MNLNQLQRLAGIKESNGMVRLPLAVTQDEWDDFLMSIIHRAGGSDGLENGWDAKVPGIMAAYFKQMILDHSIVDELWQRGAFEQLARRHT